MEIEAAITAIRDGKIVGMPTHEISMFLHKADYSFDIAIRVRGRKALFYNPKIYRNADGEIQKKER